MAAVRFLIKTVIKLVRAGGFIVLGLASLGFAAYVALGGYSDLTPPTQDQLAAMQTRIASQPLLACSVADRLSRTKGGVTRLDFVNIYRNEKGNSVGVIWLVSGYNNGWLRIECNRTRQVVRFIDRLKSEHMVHWLQGDDL